MARAWTSSQGFYSRVLWNHLNEYGRIYATLTDVVVESEPIPVENGG